MRLVLATLLLATACADPEPTADAGLEDAQATVCRKMRTTTPAACWCFDDDGMTTCSEEQLADCADITGRPALAYVCHVDVDRDPECACFDGVEAPAPCTEAQFAICTSMPTHECAACI